MPVAQATFRPEVRTAPRAESRALVVVISTLQLALVVLVWVLALLPVAVMALAMTVAQGLRSLGARAAAPRKHPLS